MRVVLDTNVLLVSLPRTSADHLILQELLNGRYTICVTTDILNEYAEIFQRKANSEVASLALDLLDILPNLERIHKYYFWRMISADPDDNKFVDCAISAGADFIVSDDNHFKEVQGKFPPVKVISKLEFMQLLKLSEE
ncbi:MAG TPA: putative toxin-antitoxin system toxin component, PIN family [Saprospiraceae bacterium]|nr:putative toxin-antitoxin system toxin component, PIN family [Saprospiraceae bacterium]HRK83320.1 putative toxin-antitoxin system toxin component, PIN family [Saprospiraceae bacterium]